MDMQDEVIIAVAGHYDPLHNGHLDSFIKSVKLGNRLLVFVSNDNDAIRKKGFVCFPQKLRIVIIKKVLEYYKIKGDVVPTLDIDGSQCKTLEYYRPDVFAKGGDRDKIHMNQDEIKVCERLGITIVYGCGDLLNSSTKIAREQQW